jgi:hypothetical protein
MGARSSVESYLILIFTDAWNADVESLLAMIQPFIFQIKANRNSTSQCVKAFTR